MSFTVLTSCSITLDTQYTFYPKIHLLSSGVLLLHAPKKWRRNTNIDTEYTHARTHACSLAHIRQIRTNSAHSTTQYSHYSCPCPHAHPDWHTHTHRSQLTKHLYQFTYFKWIWMAKYSYMHFERKLCICNTYEHVIHYHFVFVSVCFLLRNSKVLSSRSIERESVCLFIFLLCNLSRRFGSTSTWKVVMRMQILK